MSKEIPYFRFTASEWLNDDISLESYEVKGIFIDVCAYYWFKDCSITKALLEKRFNNYQGTLKHLFELGIIKSSNGSDFIEISFLNKQFDLLSESRKRRQDAGSKGGKKKRSNAKAMLKQCGSYKDKDKDKENDKEKERYIIPPPIEFIVAYCKERGNNIDANYFFDYNEARGWLINSKKMKDWQATIRYWERNDFNKTKVSESVYSKYGVK